MVRDMVHEATYPHPPEKVWRALTEQAALRAWLMENDLADTAPGARFQFRAKPQPGWRGWTDVTVVEAVPPRRLVWSWDGGGRDGVTTVAWTLEPTANGTKLTLVHSGLKGIRGTLMRAFMNRGWGGKIRRDIPAWLDGRPLATARA